MSFSGGPWRPTYFEHDVREVVRRKRKQHPNRGNSKFKGSRSSLEVRDQDGDVDMGQNRVEKRFNPYHSWPPRNKKNRGRYRNPKPRHPNNRNAENSWYKIIIPQGRKLGKDFILRAISSLCKMPFVPFNFQYARSEALFFVNDPQSAYAIKDVHRRITTPEGAKISIVLEKSGPPSVSFGPDDMEKIKNCMSKRYFTGSYHLNLSSFHTDPDLRSSGIYAPLSRPTVLHSVVNIIKEHITEVKQVDLSNNNIASADPLANLVGVCKQLKSIIFQNNQLRSMADLDKMKGLELESLVLDGNPLCDGFKDQSSFIRAVRDKFPKVVKLDGQDLPPPILFDLGTVDDIPTSKGSFFPTDDVKQLVVQFLEQYYTIYDTNDRQKLLEAYHDEAVFSLAISDSRRPTANYPGDNRNLANYSTENRNLLKISDSGHRNRLLRQGRLNVVSALSQLPLTQHDPNSFTVDISHVSTRLMCFTVSGVFKEAGSDLRTAPLQAFSRTFVVVAQGSGFCITNECLLICNATPDQIKAYKFTAPTPSPSPVQCSGDSRTLEDKQQMALDFSRQTSMNLEFSAKCLEENSWDYQKAAMMFNELNLAGKIPPVAFQK